MEAIDAFSTLNHEDREVGLVIAVNEPDADLVRKRLEELGDNRIQFVSYIRAEEKRKMLERFHLLCLPTSHGQGLPNSIVEAMAFGMPIITRPVGGIPDNFTEGKNGYYVESLDKNCSSGLLRNVISDKDGLARMIVNNYNFASNRFAASIIAGRLDNIYKTVVNG